MARSRKVEAHVAEQRALEAFWELGYERLGVRELEERAGINRFLLNTAYGGKSELFLLLLDQYTNLARDVMFASVSTGGLEEIALSFEQRVSKADMPPTGAFGCLVTNTVAEFGEKNKDIQAKVEAYFSMVRDSFNEALKRSQEKRELPKGFDIEQNAEWLLTTALGLNVRIRAEGLSKGVIQSANRTASIIRNWKI